MDQYQSIIGVISLTMGVSWASGINLYAALLMLGIGGATGNIELPPDLEALQNPLVIMAAGVMYFAEFFADKIPGLDSSWDAIHTFIRIPAGALLAAGAVGDVSSAVEIAAGIMGGGMAATSHAAKAGTRLAINTSPEPFTNWGMSITEDIAVFAGLWAALNHPFVFLALLIAFIALTVWLLPKIWKGMKFIFSKLGRLFGRPDKTDSATHEAAVRQAHAPAEIVTTNTPDITRLQALKDLLDSGALTQAEYATLKEKALKDM